MAKRVATALALLALGATVFTVGPALAGWVVTRTWVLPTTVKSMTVSTVTCATTVTEKSLQTNTVQLEMWNTGTAKPICVAWSGTPDVTDASTCDVMLGPYAGSGASDIYQSPSTVAIGALGSFKCDTDGPTSVLRLTEFVGPSP